MSSVMQKNIFHFFNESEAQFFRASLFYVFALIGFNYQNFLKSGFNARQSASR